MTADDRLLLPALDRRGIEAVPVVWDGEVEWSGFDCVVVRSCWDYHLRLGEFRAWLSRLEAAGVSVWNPLPTLRWNLHKSYLLELARKGLTVVPTVLLERGQDGDLEALRRRLGATELVVKNDHAVASPVSAPTGCASAAASRGTRWGSYRPRP